ncbi:MAG: 30S ribosomal protein S20 [Chitinophagales bacterium]|jgi:small subunit ribosomal protein S20|nr:30S ribosomal protein S20 [Bacteroidota bacterium]MBK7567371.1 30S ribosomal protein S20 [Bacteroidota bacterium]MBP8915328.1 30S ribosomal protein S20 [Chitinophagales bacterium]MBP9219943.1 30S ribosomal protein S20 [Chitinophagales bacterium]MBP9794926.1 30S ribosomal protein S20 [Chitinophagales bacterium]
MAHHKAAKKSIRQAEKRNEKNRYYGKTTRNAIKKFRNAADKAEADKLLPDVISMIDKLAKRNVIHKNKAANIKSALMKKAVVAAA